MQDRTIGAEFEGSEGRRFRPSMFLTVTLPSYGPVDAMGVPINPKRYDYRRAALDALTFGRLFDRLVQNLRCCAGFKLQYFAAVEPQKRLAPHLHAAIRGVLPRAALREVVAATYFQLWWPPLERLTDTVMWSDASQAFVNARTGEKLPTWHEALGRLDADPHAAPVHVARFGRQLDMQGVLVGSPDAQRRVFDEVPVEIDVAVAWKC